ncbi:hypothetical protein EBZ39_04690 [bacterium]|nr:hypothetical protein [bacterium]
MKTLLLVLLLPFLIIDPAAGVCVRPLRLSAAGRSSLVTIGKAASLQHPAVRLQALTRVIWRTASGVSSLVIGANMINPGLVDGIWNNPAYIRKEWEQKAGAFAFLKCVWNMPTYAAVKSQSLQRESILVALSGANERLAEELSEASSLYLVRQIDQAAQLENAARSHLEQVKPSIKGWISSLIHPNLDHGAQTPPTQQA